MNKKYALVFKLSCVTALALLLSCGFAPSFSASPVNSPEYVDFAPVQPENRTFYVGDSRELAIRAGSAAQGDVIILANNICLDTKITFKSSCCLDLNGYSILVKSDDEGLIIGQKEFSHKEKYTIKHPGYYTWEEKIKTVEHPDRFVTGMYGTLAVSTPSTQEISSARVWHPETYETCYRDIYTYDDNIDVIIKNGSIKKSEGKRGNDGQKDVWSGFNGADAPTPTAPVYVVSGAARFFSTYIQGANGGNGGDGSYQSLWHIPFGGGSAGNGGKGANSGRAVDRERKESRVLKDDFSCFTSGNPGKGGKAGQPNPNYWIYRGWNGEDGKDGNDMASVTVY